MDLDLPAEHTLLRDTIRQFMLTEVAPDMRGYNLSSKPADVTDYAVPHLVDDLRALAK